MNDGDTLTGAGLAILAFNGGHDAGTQRMLARGALGAAVDSFSQPGSIQPQLAANIYPVDRDAGVLAHHHILIAAQFDGFDVMGEDAFGDFFGFSFGGASNSFDDIRRNLFQGLDVEV